MSFALFRSLRAISVAFIVMLSLATMFTGVAVYIALVEAIDDAVDQRLERERKELLLNDPDAQELARRIRSEAVLRDSGDIGYLLEHRGRMLAHNIRLNRRLPLGLSTVGANLGVPGLTRGRALVTERADGTTLTMIIESEPIESHDRHRTIILSVGFGTILILVVVGVLALGLAVRHNIASLRSTAEAIFEGDLGARVPVIGRNSSFGRQAEAFNRMLDRIEGLMASLRGVSNDIAHDLRTPLARLRGKLAVIQARPEAEPLQVELADVMAESDDILAMFSAILRIAEVEGGEARAQFEQIDLAELALETALSIEAMVTDSGRKLHLGPWQSAPIHGDRRLLIQAIVNLVENAVNHTPIGTTIRVTVARENWTAVLCIADDGPGIAEAERARALRRFGRLDASRHFPGHGLGLPLVDAMVRLHLGEMALDHAGEAAGSGLLVSILIPCSDERCGHEKRGGA